MIDKNAVRTDSRGEGRLALLLVLVLTFLLALLAGLRLMPPSGGSLSEVPLAAKELREAAADLTRRVFGEGAVGAGPSLDPEVRTAALQPVSAAGAADAIDPGIASLNQDGVVRFRNGDAKGALEKLEDAYFKLPDHPVIARNLSSVLTFVGWQSFKSEEYDEALRSFDRALDVFDENVEAWKGSGFSRIQLKETDAAIRDFEEANRLAPGDGDTALALANLLYQTDEIDRARRVLGDLLEKDPVNGQARTLMSRLEKEDLVERRFQSNDTGHFRLKYDVSENAGQGALVGGILEEAYTRIGAEFHHFPTDPVVVILYTKEQFRAVSGSPHWSRGVFDGKIRIPVGGVNERTEELEDVVFHEYTHVIVNQITRGKCPTWLNEGLAQYMEPSSDDTKKALLGMLGRGDGIPLASLEGSFMKLPGDTARVAYAQAYASVAYIAETYSFHHVRGILDRIAAGDAAEDAVRRVLHFGYADLQTGIADFVRRTA
ncbi:MAG: tetratricopeptide repeat protein [Deltaproteobacteria bacterium]|nr:tetratricopeptide repeat protein [Deltaproteobacteria bacterium]